MKVQLLRISFVRKVGIGDAVCNFSLVQTAKRLLRCSALLLYSSFITLKQPEYSRQITMCSSPRLSHLTSFLFLQSRLLFIGTLQINVQAKTVNQVILGTHWLECPRLWRITKNSLHNISLFTKS